MGYYQVEWIKGCHHPSAPDIMLVPTKYIDMDGWTFEPDSSFDDARCTELDLNRFEGDAHRPSTGHLVSTAFATSVGYQGQTHPRGSASKRKHNAGRAKQYRATKRRAQDQPAPKAMAPAIPQVVVARLPEETELGWATRQRGSSCRSGTARQPDELFEDGTPRWI